MSEVKPDSFELTYFNLFNRYDYLPSAHFDTRNYAKQMCKTIKEKRGENAIISVVEGTRFAKLTDDINQIHDMIKIELEKAKTNDIILNNHMWICYINEIYSNPNDIRFAAKIMESIYVLCDNEWYCIDNEKNLLEFPSISKEEYRRYLKQKFPNRKHFEI